MHTLSKYFLTFKIFLGIEISTTEFFWNNFTSNGYISKQKFFCWGEKFHVKSQEKMLSFLKSSYILSSFIFQLHSALSVSFKNTTFFYMLQNNYTF